MRDPSFDEFVTEHLPVLNRYAYALTGNVQAAEDLVQETLVKLLGSWRKVRDDGNPAGYARTIMFRTYISWWRALKKRRISQPYLELRTPGDAYAAVDTWDELSRALAKLPTLQRATLVLGFLDEMPDEEIALLLERRPATIRSLRLRGLASLRSSLGRNPRIEEQYA